MRRKINFNTRWLYLAEDRKDSEQIQAAETGFQAVCLPHANTLLTRHKGPDFQEQIESYRFVSWYRRHSTGRWPGGLLPVWRNCAQCLDDCHSRLHDYRYFFFHSKSCCRRHYRGTSGNFK